MFALASLTIVATLVLWMGFQFMGPLASATVPVPLMSPNQIQPVDAKSATGVTDHVPKVNSNILPSGLISAFQDLLQANLDGAKMSHDEINTANVPAVVHGSKITTNTKAEQLKQAAAFGHAVGNLLSNVLPKRQNGSEAASHASDVVNDSTTKEVQENKKITKLPAIPDIPKHTDVEPSKSASSAGVASRNASEAVHQFQNIVMDLVTAVKSSLSSSPANITLTNVGNSSTSLSDHMQVSNITLAINLVSDQSDHVHKPESVQPAPKHDTGSQFNAWHPKSISSGVTRTENLLQDPWTSSEGSADQWRVYIGVSAGVLTVVVASIIGSVCIIRSRINRRHLKERNAKRSIYVGQQSGI